MTTAIAGRRGQGMTGGGAVGGILGEMGIESHHVCKL